MDEKQIPVDTVSVNDTDTPQDNTSDTASQLQIQIEQLNDKYMRALAELENTRRRAALDMDAAARNRAMGVARQFLPVMDAIDAAREHNPNNDGIESMARAMESAFAQIGIVRIDSVGQIMNPQFHNAIQMIDSDANPKPAKNTILSQLQAGYMFGDTVLRPAMVVVQK